MSSVRHTIASSVAVAALLSGLLAGTAAQATEPEAPTPSTITQDATAEPTQTYTVTFDSAGGSAVPAVTDVASETPVTPPAKPTRASEKINAGEIHRYEFLGWYLNDQPYDFANPVTSDLTLTAKWQQHIVVCNCERPKYRVFQDVSETHRFYEEIQWMFEKRLTTGIKNSEGKFFAPKQELTREAMAAFMYRLKGSPAVSLPSESPFADVTPSDKFYREIVWMHQQKLAKGTQQAAGKPLFGSKDALTREAMAAFIYRFEGSPNFAAPATSPLVDINADAKFRKEVLWMYENHLTTGIKQGESRIYAPKSALSREAMAAFIYRLETQYHGSEG